MRTIVTLLVAGSLAAAWGAAPAIGLAVARGSFLVDGARASGNATLFEGTTVETSRVLSELRLEGGARMRLASDSRAQVHRDYLLLERGIGEVGPGAAYQIRASGLRITAAGASSGRVALAGGSKVQVAALAGSFRVTNAEGMEVANVTTGAPLELEPQAPGASAPSHLTGCLHRKNGRLLLSDETTGVVAELTGAGLDAEAGNRLDVTGVRDPAARPAGDAGHLIRVSGWKRLAKGCPAKAAAAATKSGQAGGGAGVSVTTVSIIGGVAAAAAVGGLAAAGALPGQGDEARAPVSR